MGLVPDVVVYRQAIEKFLEIHLDLKSAIKFGYALRSVFSETDPKEIVGVLGILAPGKRVSVHHHDHSHLNVDIIDEMEFPRVLAIERVLDLFRSDALLTVRFRYPGRAKLIPLHVRGDTAFLNMWLEAEDNLLVLRKSCKYELFEYEGWKYVMRKMSRSPLLEILMMPYAKCETLSAKELAKYYEGENIVCV